MSKTRYSSTQVLIHWLVAILVLVAYLASGGPEHAKTATDKFWVELHMACGLAVFALVLIRWPLRKLSGVPPLLDAGSAQGKLAHAVHLALYALMALMPILGWLSLQGHDIHFPVFGVNLQFVHLDHEYGEIFGETHQILGNAFIVLAGLHAAAGLLHHYVFKDETLKRMLPFLK